ncbi:heat-shock protein [Vibrio parahaemolyticus]|uniref:heat-shock protein n=1 Tax=Vibrio parahaemolyticus TaxID=670 RepID=UPI0004DECD6E|nr:heat-shock protein [Vibrio parahaemolyticus]
MAKPIFNLPDKAYQFWKEFELEGTLYTFEHLNACKHEFTHPERAEKYTLYFTFSHHAFTRSLKPGEKASDKQVYPFPNEDLRMFDLDRYELSKHLPGIISSLPEQFCYHGGYSRYCSCKLEDSNGIEVTYQIVYRVWRERGKMRFHIESAYPLQKKLGKVKKVNFWVICHNLLKGKKLPKPPR